MQSYDYAHRKGVEPIPWTRFAELSRALSERLEACKLDVVIGVARAGLFPATAVACALQRELLPVRLSRREDGEVRHARPVWRVGVTDFVAEKRVAVIDEIADTGETLELVRRAVADRGAAFVVTATLVSHSWAAPAPDVCALVSDALVVFPWDQQVLTRGAWVPNPEIEAAVRLQRAR